MKNTAAYTLVEILVGITIIGLIFGFGFVSFREFSRRQALAGVSKQIKGDIRLTQELALSGKKPDDPICNPPNVLASYRFGITPPSSYYVEVRCTNNSAEGFVLVKQVDISSDLQFSSISPNPIEFKVLGQGTNIESGEKVDIVVNQLGTGSYTTVSVGYTGGVE